MAAKTMRQMLANSPKLRFTDAAVQIRSALSSESQNQLAQLADELCQDYLARQNETADKNDLKALFHIGYGLYVVTCRDGEKDNGLIVNTVSQEPNRRDHQQAQLFPPHHQADGAFERELPVCGRPL